MTDWEKFRKSMDDCPSIMSPKAKVEIKKAIRECVSRTVKNKMSTAEEFLKSINIEYESEQKKFLHMIIEDCRYKERRRKGDGVLFFMKVITDGENILMSQQEIKQFIEVITNFDHPYNLNIVPKNDRSKI